MENRTHKKTQTTNYWVIADGDDRDQWDNFRREGVVRITGRGELGDLRKYQSQGEMELALKKKYPEEFESKNPAAKARLCCNFAQEVKVGDGMFLRHGLKTILGFGVAEESKQNTGTKSSPYFFDAGHRFPHALKVHWENAGNFLLPSEFWLAQDFIASISGARLATVKAAVFLNSIPEEILMPEHFKEGAVHQISVNAYERSAAARQACIDHYGYGCAVCDHSMADLYGEIGEGVIHVHHLKDLATIGDEYEVDPIDDLRPVCPNCHAVLHTDTPAMSISMLREILAKRKRK